jgi:DNA-binding NtrC family response regulator
VRRAAAAASAARAAAIDVPHLALASPSDPAALLSAAAHAGWSLRQLADAYIKMVLDETGGNVAEAARRLGIARKTLYTRGR